MRLLHGQMLSSWPRLHSIQTKVSGIWQARWGPTSRCVLNCRYRRCRFASHHRASMVDVCLSRLEGVAQYCHGQRLEPDAAAPTSGCLLCVNKDSPLLPCTYIKACSTIHPLQHPSNKAAHQRVTVSALVAGQGADRCHQPTVSVPCAGSALGRQVR